MTENIPESAVADAITALNGAVDAAKGGVKKAAEEAARKIDISKCKITVKGVTYTGKAVTAKAMKAAVTVKYGKKALENGTDYSLTYDKALKAVGPATVTVVGKGKVLFTCPARKRVIIVIKLFAALCCHAGMTHNCIDFIGQM